MKVSGKFVLRIPPALHAELASRARRLGTSLNQVCLDSLQAEPSFGAKSSNDELAAPMRAIQKAFGRRLVGVILFGSAARGEQTSESDLDLLLVMEQTTVLDRDLYTEWDRLKIAGRISPQFVTFPESVADAGGIWCECAMEGITLWERNLEVSRFLSRVRSAIAEGLVVRGQSHGHTYWTRARKPA